MENIYITQYLLHYKSDTGVLLVESDQISGIGRDRWFPQDVRLVGKNAISKIVQQHLASRTTGDRLFASQYHEAV